MEQETWNMATATLKRFDFLLKQFSLMAQTKNLPGCFTIIMDLRRNLVAFMPEKEFEEADNKLNSLPKGWNTHNGKILPEHFAKINQTLDEVYMVYIKTMKAKGLLMPKSIDTSKAVIQM